MKLVIFDIEKTTVDMDSFMPYEGIVEVLTQLRANNVKTAFISDLPQDKTQLLIDQLFPGLVDGTYRSSDQFLSVMESFGADTSNCFYASGRPENIRSAKAAGLYVMGIAWDIRIWDDLLEAGADWIIYRWDEILRGASADTVHNFKQPGYIPQYWHAHINEKIRKIHQNQIKAGKSAMSFGLISDIHWDRSRPCYSGAIWERIADACAIPYIFNGGDTVSGAGTCAPDRLFTELEGYHREFSKLESRMLMAQGNHDPSYSEFEPPRYYAQCLTKAEIYEYLFRYETKYPDRVISEDGSYFYADSPRHKVRLIVLNPYDVPSDEVNEDGSAKYNKMRLMGYRQTQLEWFANVALDVPSTDWTVVLCTHANPATNVIEDDYFCRNEDALLAIINAYRSGIPYQLKTRFEDIPDYDIDLSGDFTGSGGEFAVWVSGHTHIDLMTVENGTLCTAIISDWNHQAKGLPFHRTGGTFREHAFDIFTIDTKNHKLYVTRVGAGDDREYDYTPRS